MVVSFYIIFSDMKETQANSTDQPNNLQLVEQIRKGDYKAFKALFENYYTILCNFSLRYVDEHVQADDIVQEVFIRIWENRKRLVITGSVKSYLFAAVKNQSLNRLKAESVRLEHTRYFSGRQNKLVDPLEIEHEEFRDYLFQCIEKLPPRCKEVFLESRFNGSKQEMIADSLNITLKTVKAQIGKALKLLKTCIQTYYPEYF